MDVAFALQKMKSVQSCFCLLYGNETLEKY